MRFSQHEDECTAPGCMLRTVPNDENPYPDFCEKHERTRSLTDYALDDEINRAAARVRAAEAERSRLQREVMPSWNRAVAECLSSSEELRALHEEWHRRNQKG